MFFGLPFLKNTEVEDGFIHLMTLCPNDVYGHRFADYILKTYVEPDCFFLQFYGQKNHLNILGKFIQQILNISEIYYA